MRVLARVAVLALLAVLATTRVLDERDRPDQAAPGSAALAVSPFAALDDQPARISADELGGLRFTEVGAAAGLVISQSDQSVIGRNGMSSGAAVMDVDRDGRPDIYLTRVGEPNSLYHNNGDGTFTDIAATAGVQGNASHGSAAAAFADIDGDGCLDLFVAGSGSGLDVLYRNDCAGRFEDVTAASGLSVPPVTSTIGSQMHGVTFDDFDHDGNQDLLVLHWDTSFFGGQAAQQASRALGGQDAGPVTCRAMEQIRAGGFDRPAGVDPNRSRLWHNDGKGRFTDVTSQLGLRLDQIAAFTGQFADVTGDGWDDLLIAGDFCTSRIYRNDSGRGFTDITASSGVATDENAMGSVVRDVDGDGLLDWFVTSIAYPTADGTCPFQGLFAGCTGNRLYLGVGPGTFVDATDDAEVRNGWWGWGVAIEDFGDDGRLEIAQTNGFVDESSQSAADDPSANAVVFRRFIRDPMRFWLPRGGAHVDAAEAVGLTDTSVGHALVPFDYDGDGDLDLLIASSGVPPLLYRNDRPASRGWATIALVDPTSRANRDAVGARLRITASEGATPVHGWISTGGSYESQKPALFHLGLGERHEPLATVEIWWPGSATPQVERDVPVDRLVTIARRA